jgi:hypothetical protein
MPITDAELVDRAKDLLASWGMFRGSSDLPSRSLKQFRTGAGVDRPHAR